MCVFPPVPPPPCFQCVAHFSVNTEARRFILISLFPVRQCIIHQLSLQMCMRERWKGKPSVKVNTSTAPSPSHNHQKCYGKTKVSSKKKKMARFRGPRAATAALFICPALHERLKKGLRRVHEIITSPMRLRDKTRREREFSHLPGAR